MTKNFFDNPQYYRDQLTAAQLVKGGISSFSGKSFICVSLTRFCPVGCKFCFFKSGPVFKQATREDLLTSTGIEKFISFSNKVNLGYLLVSGGGEPMMERKSILDILQHVQSERIVLVTSAHWAKTYEAAERYLQDIMEALNRRVSKTSATIRVSVDSEHSFSLSLNPIINLIKLFSLKYKSVPQLDLQIHSLVEDPAIDMLIEQLKNDYTITRQGSYNEKTSDGKSVIKVVPKQEIILFNEMPIKIGYAKAFYSDLRVDLNNRHNIQKNIDVYQKDLFESEDGNSSIVTNKLGNPGLDFWVNYNGNVTTWGNQYLDNLFNLYIDTPEEVIVKTLSDPAALSYIEKGANYRDRIVSEVNEIAVLRSKAVNIRDYTGALMFDEARTRLYYTVRVLQDYIAEERVNKNDINNLSEELKLLISIDKESLKNFYNSSNFTIVEQTIQQNFDKDYVLDILEWIKLGHYKLSTDKISNLINYYNSQVNVEDNISDLFKLTHSLKMQVVRMTEHLTHIKPEALKNFQLVA